MKLKNLKTQELGRLTGSLILLFLIPICAMSQEEDKTVTILDKTVWTIQAESIAHEFELKKKSSNNLTKAYLELRTDVSAQGSMDNFNKKLADILSSDQAEKASFVLGSLNNRWDQYLGILVGFELENESMEQASNAVYEYIDIYLQERKKASDANTRFSGRTATSLKEGLDEKISELLSEEQYAEWSRSTARKSKSNQ